MSAPAFVGAGLHTALGAGVTRNLEALFAAPPKPSRHLITGAHEPVSVPALLLADRPLENIGARSWSVAEAVVGEAIAAAGLTREEVREAALLLGTSSLDIAVSEAIYERELREGRDAHPLTSNSTMGRLAQRLRQAHGIRGPDYTICTACTASANALIYANMLVRTGRVRHAIVVGVEMFNIITALGFQSLNCLAPQGMKPFDSARGLTLGESCAALVVGLRAQARFICAAAPIFATFSASRRQSRRLHRGRRHPHGPRRRQARAPRHQRRQGPRHGQPVER